MTDPKNPNDPMFNPEPFGDDEDGAPTAPAAPKSMFGPRSYDISNLTDPIATTNSVKLTPAPVAEAAEAPAPKSMFGRRAPETLAESSAVPPAETPAFAPEFTPAPAKGSMFGSASATPPVETSWPAAEATNEEPVIYAEDTPHVSETVTEPPQPLQPFTPEPYVPAPTYEPETPAFAPEPASSFSTAGRSYDVSSEVAAESQEGFAPAPAESIIPETHEPATSDFSHASRSYDLPPEPQIEPEPVFAPDESEDSAPTAFASEPFASEPATAAPAYEPEIESPAAPIIEQPSYINQPRFDSPAPEAAPSAYFAASQEADEEEITTPASHPVADEPTPREQLAAIKGNKNPAGSRAKIRNVLLVLFLLGVLGLGWALYSFFYAGNANPTPTIGSATPAVITNPMNANPVGANPMTANPGAVVPPGGTSPADTNPVTPVTNGMATPTAPAVVQPFALSPPEPTPVIDNAINRRAANANKTAWDLCGMQITSFDKVGEICYLNDIKAPCQYMDYYRAHPTTPFYCGNQPKPAAAGSAGR